SEYPLVNYWTIVSNAEGELSSTIETDNERSRQKLLTGHNIASATNEPEEQVQLYYVSVLEDIDEYINPIHSPSVNID
ncbi:hypothetical protein CHS0354_015019, partial [Potamilus streckersoni]